MRGREPLNPRAACWVTPVTLRHGVSHLAALCPLARTTLAQALLPQPGARIRRRLGSVRLPAPVGGRGEPEVAVGRPEPGECRGLRAPVTYTPFGPDDHDHGSCRTEAPNENMFAY